MEKQINKIKENKYKILRMSLLLGTGVDREEMLNNFEDASREIDAMNDEVYLKNIEDKFYDTLNLEDEEKKRKRKKIIFAIVGVVLLMLFTGQDSNCMIQ